MDRLLRSFLPLDEFRIRTDDDFVDRLNRQYTPLILVIFTTLVSIKQYAGKPMDCWCPAQFARSHKVYANAVCWVSGTYYTPFDERMPVVTEPRQHISYYQWVPLILICQATLFFLPCSIWRFLHRRIGFNLSAVIEIAQTVQSAIYPETKDKSIRYMVAQMDGYLIKHRYNRQTACGRMKAVFAKYFCIFCSRTYGNYLTCVYLFTKLLYIGNAVGQLFMLDYFLGMEKGYHLYGIQVLARLVKGEDWALSERFPCVTLCDFEIRQKTNVHRYTLQCVLPINLFSGKIFIFLWFWLLGIAIITLFNFVGWFTRVFLLHLQIHYVTNQLKCLELDKAGEKEIVRQFVKNYLRRDGLLIVRLISRNAGSMISAELLKALWMHYGASRRMMQPSRVDIRPQSQSLSQSQGQSKTNSLRSKEVI